MIVVTTPTGQIGSQIVARLFGAGAHLRLIARGADKLPEAVRGAAEVIEGSHNDPATLNYALDGADALFWLAPPDMSKTLDAAISTSPSPPPMRSAITASSGWSASRRLDAAPLGRTRPGSSRRRCIWMTCS